MPAQRKPSFVYKTMVRLIRDESGATAIEYAIMVAAIATVIITVVYSMGGSTLGNFDDLDSRLP